MSEQQPHSERAHALLSASGASRWIACTPSPRLEEGFPEQPSSVFAEEGTLAHELSELKLRSALKLARKEKSTPAETKQRRTKLAEILEHPLYKEEMVGYTDAYVSYCMELYSEAESRGSVLALVEEKVSLEDYVEEGFGSCDFILISDGFMDVADLKYGAGLIVSADDNPQLKLYGLGALEAVGWMYDVHTVRLHIVQPRRDAISSYEISATDLTQWGVDVVRPKSKQAFAGEGEQVTGDHCRWCRAQTHCRKFAQEAEALAALDFADPRLLSDDEILDAYKSSSKITSWLGKVAEFVYKEALAGRSWEGLKLVEGRSNRAWRSAKEVEDALIKAGYNKEDFMKESLAGIGHCEKLLGKKGFETLLAAHTIKPPGKPSLVPLSDKRQPMDLSGDFDVVDSEEEGVEI